MTPFRKCFAQEQKHNGHYRKRNSFNHNEIKLHSANLTSLFMQNRIQETEYTFPGISVPCFIEEVGKKVLTIFWPKKKHKELCGNFLHHRNLKKEKKVEDSHPDTSLVGRHLAIPIIVADFKTVQSYISCRNFQINFQRLCEPLLKP